MGYIYVLLAARPNISILNNPKRFYKAESLADSFIRICSVEYDQGFLLMV